MSGYLDYMKKRDEKRMSSPEFTKEVERLKDALEEQKRKKDKEEEERMRKETVPMF